MFSHVLTGVRYLEISIRFGLEDLSKMAAAVSTSVVADLLYSAVSLMMDSLCRLNQQMKAQKSKEETKQKNARQTAKRRNHD